MNDSIFPEHIDWSDKTILIYERDECSALLLAEILCPTKINIIHIQQKSKMMNYHAPSLDIIIFGIDVEDMVSGLPFTRKVRLSHPGIPMIAHSACCISQESYEAGCDAFLSKPFDFADLADLLIFFLGE